MATIKKLLFKFKKGCVPNEEILVFGSCFCARPWNVLPGTYGKGDAMKLRKLLVDVLLLTLLLQIPALATEKKGKVTVKLPSFAVTLNGMQIDPTNSEYPLIVYRDITYFPMTYHGARFLHLKCNWYSAEPKGILFVGYSETNEQDWTDYPAKGKNPQIATATVAEDRIAVNTTDGDKFLDNVSEDYPVLNFRGVTYFPLTWRFAVNEFGWDYQFDHENGLRISVKDQFRPELEDTVLASTQPSSALMQKTYIYDGEKNEYVGYPYSNMGGASFAYQKKGEKKMLFDASKICSDGEYLFDRQLGSDGGAVQAESAPVLKDGILTISAVRTNNNGQRNVLLRIDMRNQALLP